jgi:hypothetical protein
MVIPPMEHQRFFVSGQHNNTQKDNMHLQHSRKNNSDPPRGQRGQQGQRYFVSGGNYNPKKVELPRHHSHSQQGHSVPTNTQQGAPVGGWVSSRVRYNQKV